MILFGMGQKNFLMMTMMKLESLAKYIMTTLQ